MAMGLVKGEGFICSYAGDPTARSRKLPRDYIRASLAARQR